MGSMTGFEVQPYVCKFHDAFVDIFEKMGESLRLNLKKIYLNHEPLHLPACNPPPVGTASLALATNFPEL